MNLFSIFVSSLVVAIYTPKIISRRNTMSPYFNCFKCSRIYPYPQVNKTCPHCGSTDGRIMTDDEFNRQEDIGAIRLIDPSTGKPIKKKKRK